MGLVIEFPEAQTPHFPPPHEFSVPFASASLHWGRKKRLRCVNPSAPAPAPALGLSPSSSSDHNCTPYRAKPPPPPHLPAYPASSSSPPVPQPSPPPSDRPSVVNLLVRFPSRYPTRDEDEGASPPPPVPLDLSSGAPTETLKAGDEECPPGGGALGWSLRSRTRGGGVEKRKKTWRTELWVSLSRDEIDEDFLWMTGAKPPRRPRRRWRATSDQLKGVFPGSWLPSKIMANRYKVSEPSDSRKG